MSKDNCDTIILRQNQQSLPKPFTSTTKPASALLVSERELPEPALSNCPRSQTSLRQICLYLLPCVLLYATFKATDSFDPACTLFGAGCSTKPGLCPQASAVIPVKNAGVWKSFSQDLESENFQKQAIDWLAGSIKVPNSTESYDNQEPPGVDPRWKTFDILHEYLKKAFPLVYSNLEVTTMNTYNLIFHWQGSDEGLKPLLFAAHQDVVPVDPKTVEQWEHPPYSGHFDGESIWGRGSADDKSALVGILTVFESFLQKGFKPTRSVVAAFGYDEESSGVYGAKTLAPFLEDRYGKYGFAFVIDEGGTFQEKYGADFATPAIAEKGYLDMRVQVKAPGGHSSIPPTHTTIGMLSALLVHYEDHPIPFTMQRASPVHEMMQCYAAHGPTIDKKQRQLIAHSAISKSGLRKLSQSVAKGEFGVGIRSLAVTTQAIDLISGGIKSNALPEEASAVINHRISATSSVSDVIEHSMSIFKGLAREFNLTFTSFGESLSSGPSEGSLTTSDAWGTGLEPAPISPADSAAFQLLAGTIRTTYNAHRGLEEGEKSVIVSPGIMNGNTDTKYYWNLSQHIYRYHHRYSGKADMTPGLHTVNERIPLNVYLEILRFFATLILNADEVNL